MDVRILRGHHLLCVHGFQGMGYSPRFIEKMTTIVQDIRNEKIDYPIKVVATVDDACHACPHRLKEKCSADEGSQQHVLSMDQKVIDHLQLTINETYFKSELMERTKAMVKPEDLDFLCDGCSWLSYGMCKQGIKELNKNS